MAPSVRRVLFGLALVWGSAPAWAAAPVFVLPPGEAAATWDGPLSLAGFVRGEGAGGGAQVKVVVAGASWRLEVRDGAGGVRSVTVAAPRDAREREELVWLAASLLRPARSPSTVLAGVPAMVPAELPPPAVVAASPAAPPAKPVATLPARPVGTPPARPVATPPVSPAGSPPAKPAVATVAPPAGSLPTERPAASSPDPAASGPAPLASAPVAATPSAPSGADPATIAAGGGSSGDAAPPAGALAAAPGAASPVDPPEGGGAVEPGAPTSADPAALAAAPPPAPPEGTATASLVRPDSGAAASLDPPARPGPRVEVDAYGLAELRSGASAIPGVSGGLRLGLSPRWSLTAWGAGGANVPVEAVGAERHLSLGYVGLGAAWSSSAAPHGTALELGGGGGLALWGLVTEGEGSQTRLGPSAWLRPALRVHLAGPVDLRLAVPFGVDAGRVEVLQDGSPVTSLGRAWVRPGLGLGWSS